MTFRFPEHTRLFRTPHDHLAVGTTCGHALFPGTGTRQLHALASDGAGWQHVSVSIYGRETTAIPNWEEMCRVKAVFWDADDVVVQFHPREAEYVNNRAGVLHLWRPVAALIPTPPPELVGKVGLEGISSADVAKIRAGLDPEAANRRGYERLVDQLDEEQFGCLWDAVQRRQGVRRREVRA